MAMSYEEMEDMSGKFIPENVRYLVDSMSQYSRNRFRLESVSADTASAGRIITVNLPEGACLDLQSFRFHFDALTTSSTVGAETVYGKLPNDAAQSLIQRVEVNLNGVAAQQGAAEWNTLYQMKKLKEGSVPRASTVDRAVAHYEINDANAVDNESLVCQDWAGFLGESSTRFIDTAIWGQAQVRLTMAPNSVLVPKRNGAGAGFELGDPLTVADALTAAGNISYSISNLYFTIDSVSLNPIYSKMLRDRLENDDYLPLNYKEYYTFSLDSITTGSSVPRFSLSSGCIDDLMAIYRDSNYQTTGVVCKKLTDAAPGAGAFVANYCRFRNYDSSTDLAGTFRYNWSVNNVQSPQYRADKMDALCDVNYCPDKVGMGAEGTLVSSKSSFQDGKFLLCQKLNHPTRWGVGCQSGFNSRGISTMMTLNVSGQVIPAASPAPAGDGTTAVLNAFVVVATTAQARAGVGKNVAILF